MKISGLLSLFIRFTPGSAVEPLSKTKQSIEKRKKDDPAGVSSVSSVSMDKKRCRGRSIQKSPVFHPGRQDKSRQKKIGQSKTPKADNGKILVVRRNLHGSLSATSSHRIACHMPVAGRPSDACQGCCFRICNPLSNSKRMAME
jgi:hypothetical protein